MRKNTGKYTGYDFNKNVRNCIGLQLIIICYVHSLVWVFLQKQPKVLPYLIYFIKIIAKMSANICNIYTLHYSKVNHRKNAKK